MRIGSSCCSRECYCYKLTRLANDAMFIAFLVAVILRNLEFGKFVNTNTTIEEFEVLEICH